MGFRRFVPSLLIGSALVLRAGETVDQAAARVEQFASRSTAELRPEFRILAAQALKARYPQLSSKFVNAALEDVRTHESIEFHLLDGLATLAPAETIALLPHLKPGSDMLIAESLMRSHQVRMATPLYRASFKRGLQRTDLWPLFERFAEESPDDAKAVFTDFLAAFSFEGTTPYDLFGLANCADAMSALSPAQAVDVFERVLTIASVPGYANNFAPVLTATFEADSKSIATSNSRDTLLIAAGARLRVLAPARFEKYKEVLAPWELKGAVKIKKFTNGPPPAAALLPPAEHAISERMKKLRSLSADDRAREVIDLAHAIQALPKGSKADLASTVAGYAAEGDNGKEALNAAAAVLGQCIQEGPPQAQDYLELATLVRYEHASAPFSDPSLDAAGAVLALRDRIRQDATLTLNSMDGKTYSLAALRGKVVLVNFWATWCPPCRAEMPDIEKLHRQFAKKGLVVLAVSAEDRETVAGFLEKQHYTFPILLDPDRKANDAFGIEGIPNSFIFNAEGKLVAQAIDMRTERQFLELLKEAGFQ